MPIERPPEYYNEIYSKENSSYRLQFQDSPYYKIWERVISLIPVSTPCVLDIGCGIGQFAEMFKSTGIKYTGVDFSEEAISMAKERNPELNFYCQSVYALNINVSALIVCLETLEHIDDFRFIERIPMGVEIIFTVPDFADPAHIRYFKNITEIVQRYYRHIDFSHLEKFESWFICKGVRI